MFNSAMARMYCCDPIENIKGFKEASESSEKYHIHHRFEEMGLSQADLKELGMYYNRPACELVFMNGREHNKMHTTLIPTDRLVNGQFKDGHIPEFTEEHRRHISEAKKGVKQTPEHTLHVVEACAPIRATKEFKDKLHNAQERIWTPEKRSRQSEVTKRIWATNAEFRKTIQTKFATIIKRDLEEYKKYKSNGGELSWKPFRSWLAKQRKSK